MKIFIEKVENGFILEVLKGSEKKVYCFEKLETNMKTFCNVLFEVVDQCNEEINDDDENRLLIAIVPPDFKLEQK